MIHSQGLQPNLVRCPRSSSQSWGWKTLAARVMEKSKWVLRPATKGTPWISFDWPSCHVFNWSYSCFPQSCTWLARTVAVGGTYQSWFLNVQPLSLPEARTHDSTSGHVKPWWMSTTMLFDWWCPWCPWFLTASSVPPKIKPTESWHSSRVDMGEILLLGITFWPPRCRFIFLCITGGAISNHHHVRSFSPRKRSGGDLSLDA